MGVSKPFKRGRSFYVSVRFHGCPTVQVPLETRDPRKAARAALDLSDKFESGVLERELTLERLTWPKFLELYKTAYLAAGGPDRVTSRERSWRGDQFALDHFVRYAESRTPPARRIDQVTPAIADGFLDWRVTNGRVERRDADGNVVSSRAIQPSTANHDLRVVKAAFTWATRPRGPLAGMQNPFTGVRQGKTTRRRIYWLRQQQAEQFVASLSTASSGISRAALLMLYAGLRLLEAIYLRWCDVDLDGNVIVIRDHDGRDGHPDDGFRVKDRQARAVPIAAELRVRLIAWQRAETSEDLGINTELFSTAKLLAECGLAKRPRKKPRHPGHPDRLLDDANVRARLNAIATKLGFKITPQALRRTFASILRERGVPLEKISTYLGHSSVSVTEAWYAGVETTGDDAHVSKLAFTKPGKGLRVVQGHLAKTRAQETKGSKNSGKKNRGAG